jgi:uncharacterized Rmd1/YagE family protein
MQNENARRVEHTPKLPDLGQRVTVHAVLVGDRIDTAGLAEGEKLSTLPLAFRAGGNGIVVVFRYGVVVFIGLAPEEEEEVMRRLAGRVQGAFQRREEETALIEATGEAEDNISPGGLIRVREITLDRLVLAAYALADSVVLSYDERDVAAVLDKIEPFARELALHGRQPANRREILKHIGHTLLVQHRLSGRVAVGEDPDLLWDHPELNRLYARLKEEYELKDRADGLARKLDVIGDTARTLADLIDTTRSQRLELMIVLLIVFEIAITFFQIFTGIGSH